MAGHTFEVMKQVLLLCLQVFGNISNAKSKATLDHALTCQLNARNDFTCIESLSEHQQVYAHMLREPAFANLENVSKTYDGASCSYISPCLLSPSNDLSALSVAFGNSGLQHDKNNDVLSILTSRPDDLSQDMQRRQLRIFGSGDQQSHGSESSPSAADIVSDAIASLKALNPSDTDGFSRLLSKIFELLSSDDIFENLEQIPLVEQQFPPPDNLEAAYSTEFWFDMVNEYILLGNGIHSLTLTDPGPGSSTCHQMQQINEDVNSDPGNLIDGTTEHLQSVALKNTFSRSYQQEELDIDEPSAGVTNNSLRDASITKCRIRWAKMSSLVRWFLLMKAITLHVAKKRRLC